jgi:hypothetical protein
VRIQREESVPESNLNPSIHMNHRLATDPPRGHQAINACPSRKTTITSDENKKKIIYN